MGEVLEGNPPIPAVTPRSAVLAPPLLIRTASSNQSQHHVSAPKTPKTPGTSCIITPLDSPMGKAIVSMQGYLEDAGHFTNKVGSQDAWLPITASRNGNAYYSAFHTLNSGIGVQALLLPVAFTVLGWTWGIICLSLAFVWQLYTLWLLIQLHESLPGTRYSRYLHLAKAAFGEKRGKLLALFPIMYLSGGTCVTLIMFVGGSMKLFFQIVCGPACKSGPLSTLEWYLVFVGLAIVLAQLPNLNSIAGVSLIAAITAIAYCTLIWVVSVSKSRPTEISYDPVKARSDISSAFGTLNALGIIAFAFRGHNLVLEIQATMPSSEKFPSRVPMWRGVKFAYLLIAMCLFPLAVGGFWAYGNKIPANGGMLRALYIFHEHDTSRFVLGLIIILVVINCLSSFQIYAMPVFDNLELAYISKKNKPCPWWVRSGLRVFFGSLTFFIAVAIPFLGSLAGLLGGIALPITLAYPCFMWILIMKPKRHSVMWYFNCVLGSLGMVLSILLVAGAIWSIVDRGIYVRFFKS